MKKTLPPQFQSISSITPKGYVPSLTKPPTSIRQSVKPYQHISFQSPNLESEKIEGIYLPKLPNEIGTRKFSYPINNIPLESTQKNKITSLIGARIYREKIPQKNTFKPTPYTKFPFFKDYKPHTFVEFLKGSNNRELGMVLEHSTIDGEHFYKVLTREGEYLVEHEKINFHFQQCDTEKNVEGIVNMIGTSLKLEQTISIERIESLWRKQLNNRKSGSISLVDAAVFFFGETSALNEYASFRLLSIHSNYFRVSNNYEFECRSIREVEEISVFVRTNNESKVREKEELIYLLEKLIANSHHHEIHHFENLKSKTMTQIQQVATSWKPRPVDFSDLMNFALQKAHSALSFEKHLKPLSIDHNVESCFRLCIKLNLFMTQDPFFLRANIPIDFSELIEIQARQVKRDVDPDCKIRRNLKHLKVYAIDDASTKDVDDAISLEMDGNDCIVYVHIADVTRLIPFGSEIQKNAFDRITSIYLPNLKVPMMPTVLSEDVLSLSSKRENYCMTFETRLNEAGTIENYEIYPSVISPVIQIDYDEMDKMFESKKVDSSLLNMLYKSEQRLQKRIQNGASPWVIPRPDIKVKDNEKALELTSTKDHKSLSRKIVQEMMILANEVSAKYANKYSIDIPYKGTIGERIENEPFPELNLHEMIILDAKTQVYLPTRISQKPSYHQGLGVEAYTQVTSPIRRTIDLLVHYQLKAHLHGVSTPLNWQQIQVLIHEMESKNKQISNLGKNSEKFWICKYFEANRRSFKALVVDCQGVGFEYKLNVYLVENAFKTRIVTLHEYNSGEIINVIPSTVSPNELKVEFVAIE